MQTPLPGYRRRQGPLAGALAALIGVASIAALPAQDATVAWRRDPSPTTESIRQIHVADDVLWVLADGQVYRRQREGPWQPSEIRPNGRWVTMVAATPDRIYGVTEEHPQQVERLEAGRFTALGPLGRCAAFAIPMTSFAGTFAAGCPYYAGLVFWRADETAVVETGPDMAPRALAAIGPGDLVVIDPDGVKRATRDNPRATVILARKDRPRFVWATRHHIVIGTTEGVFSHLVWDAATNRIEAQTESQIPGSVTVLGVWGRSSDDLYAVGRGGLATHFDGRRWSAVPTGVTIDLASVAGNATGVWAAGDGGVVLSLDAK